MVAYILDHFDQKTKRGNGYYTFSKLYSLWSNIMGFSVVPLRIATKFGYAFSALGVILALYAVISKIIHPQTPMGWPSIMAALCFFAGLNLMFLGLIGEYIGRIFLGVSNNPQFVVRRIDEHGRAPYFVSSDGTEYELKEKTQKQEAQEQKVPKEADQ